MENIDASRGQNVASNPPNSDLPIRTFKRAGWILFYIGLGGTIPVVLQTAIGGLGITRLWLWCPGLGISAAALLIFCYRREPPTGVAPWHLKLEDLLFVSICTAILLGLCQAIWPDAFGLLECAFALSICFGMVIGLLRAQRRGLHRPLQRWPYAAGFGAMVVGLIGVGALVAATLLDGLSWGIWFDWVNRLLFSNAPFWALRLHRMCLLCLPVGVLILTISKFQLRIRAKDGRPSGA